MSVFDCVVEFVEWETIWVEYRVLCEDTVNLLFEIVEIQEKDINISLLLTCDQKMRELNYQYRNLDVPTNVLSFEGDRIRFAEDMPLFLGSIAIGYESVKREALEQNKKFVDHFLHLLVHGVLHLFGYDHTIESDRDVMENLEINILSKINIANPYE